MKIDPNYILKASKQMLRNRNYLIAFISLIFVFFSIFVVIPVLFIPANSFAIQLNVFNANDYTLLSVLSVLASLLIVMQVFSYKHTKQCSPGKAVVGSGSAIVGTASCASCLVAVFGLLGLGIGTVSFLIKYQLIIVSISILLILISLYFTSLRISGICIPIQNKERKLMGNVTCPKCKHKQPMQIPVSSCQAFYKCERCSKTISAKKSCCVFCDYGDRKCPVAEKHKK